MGMILGLWRNGDQGLIRPAEKNPAANNRSANSRASTTWPNET
jgi:hypothetical protein